MKKLFIITLASFLCFGFTMQKKTKVIFFGDSITELGARPGGYIPKTDSLCKGEGKGEQYEFTGSGIGGNKVYDLYLRLEDDVLAKNPDVVVIYVGVNDVWHKTTRGTGTDPDKFEKFYLAILRKLKDRNIKPVLCTPAVVGERTDFSNPLDGDLNLYSNIIRGMAARNNLPLTDLRKRFLDYLKENNPDNKGKDILTYDGVHMNANGNQLIADAMWEALKNM
ncbi:MAG: SGNH/GDSL hydrolase family protein [Bacteroidota bacterium]